MTRVGVKELKNRLSHFLRLARAGARIQVTDHGRPVAEIGPVQAARTGDRVQRALMEAAALGQLRLPGGRGLRPFRAIRLKGGATLSDAVIEDRGVIHYLDTSALVKRYVIEPGTEQVRGLFGGSPGPAVSRLAVAETAVALCRRAREGHLAPRDRDVLIERVGEDLLELLMIEVTAEVVDQAVKLARGHPLRAYDALHLASALWLKERIADEVCFVGADRGLVDCARRSGLEVLVPRP